MTSCSSIVVVLGIALTTLTASAKVVVNGMFTDNMVIQCDTDVPVWGTATPGETVVVEYVPAAGTTPSNRRVSTQADEGGKWLLTLKPLPASRAGARLIVTGDKSPGTSMELQNVLVGEVWLGAGQSNMAYGTRHFAEYDPDLKKACAGDPDPALRIYVGGAWQIADAKNLTDFSALLFSFGHALHHELDVPVGLMVGAVNGTPSGRWLTEEMAGASPSFVECFKKNSGYDSFESMNADYAEQRAKWKDAVKKAKSEGKKAPRFSHPAQPMGELYEKHIRPFVPFAIRGVLWDQGESGTMVPGVDQYTTMGALIDGWRNAWSRDDLPFLHMQKPSGLGCTWDDSLPTDRKPPLEWVPMALAEIPADRNCELNLQHIKIGTIPHAPLVTTSDLTPGVHPQTKYAYGKRACMVALGTVYDRDIITCGPVYKSYTVRGDAIEVAFDNIGKGLVFRHGDKLQGFEIAADDLKWAWADATIQGDRVIVRSDAIKSPRHVRYAYCRTFNWANLFNKDGLPALMFTTSPEAPSSTPESDSDAN